VLGHDTLCIHAIQLSGRDIDRLAAGGVAVAHCPVSNARHGHGAAPLGALLAAGIRVGLGTDSVASVGNLDLMHEARVARTLGGLGAHAALGLATLEGARALGLGSETGSLKPGKWGDVTAVAPRTRVLGPDSDPIEQALASAPGDTIVTVLGGRLVYRKAPRA
jgi:5-methylthioadenosine/S-adenosylhomocysteine deaminase